MNIPTLNKKIFNLKNKKLITFFAFILWSCLVSYLGYLHEFWRDEVRVLSFATQGNNIIEMWQGVHGEGHPILWYLMVRVGYYLWPRPEILPILAYLVAFFSFLLLVRKSPLGLVVILLILFSTFGLYEYSVMARNYGISMLLLFALAACYEKYRLHSIVLGALLFLLTNTNVHSIILAFSFLVFWFFDNIYRKEINQKQFLKTFSINALIAFCGVLVCFFTVYPTFNDAARLGSGIPEVITIKYLLNALILPAEVFGTNYGLLNARLVDQYKWIGSILLFGSPLVMINRPAATIATWIALILLILIFSVLYPGGYRHQVLWLIFLISMYWISSVDETIVPRISPAKTYGFLNIKTIRNIGLFLFFVLLVLQFGLGAAKWRIKEDMPDSSSFSLSSFISKKPELKDAIIVSDVDFMLEPLPYYINNPIYQLRQQKFGKIIPFTKNAILGLTLEELLSESIRLKKVYKKNVIILLKHKLNQDSQETFKEGYNWTFTTTPEQVRKFAASTEFLAYFGPSLSDENYYAYQLN